jgi:hypothetical protein
MHKITTLTCPLPPPSTPVRATPSELPSLRRSRSCKRPDRWNPPANALLANAHEMSMERRKPHRHDTPPSRIDPSLCWDGYTSALPVESHLLRAATPTEGPTCAENPGRKEGREDGVKQHQAIHGYEATLQRRTKGNSRVAGTMETSLAGDSDGKPAFWPSGVRSSLQTAARTR